MNTKENIGSDSSKGEYRDMNTKDNTGSDSSEGEYRDMKQHP